MVGASSPVLHNTHLLTARSSRSSGAILLMFLARCTLGLGAVVAGSAGGGEPVVPVSYVTFGEENIHPYDTKKYP